MRSSSITLIKIAKKSIIPVILILLFLGITNQNAEATNGIISAQVQSRMPGNEHIPIIIILKDISSFQSLSKDNAVLRLKSRASESQTRLDTLLNEEKKKGKADKITKFWIVNAIAVYASPELIESLSERDDVAGIEFDSKVHMMEGFSVQVSQGQIDAATNEIKRINATNVWELGIDGSGINVSIIDTGINALHPDISGRVIKWVDFVNGLNNSSYDDYGHGTHVAGTVGGNGTDGITTGVAPNVSLFGVKVLDSAGNGNETTVIQGIEWSIENKANIISMSLGSTQVWTTPNCDDYDKAMSEAINNSIAAGVIVVAAAGNSAGGVSLPGCIGNATAVGAVDSNDAIAYFSGRGAAMADHGVVAPGVGITSLNYLTTGYIPDSGTSMATPHVSGAAALLLQAARLQGTALSPEEIRSILENTSVDLGTPGKDNIYGAGRINVYAAIFSIGPSVIPNPTYYPVGFTAARNGTAITLNATITDEISGIKNASVNTSLLNTSIDTIWLNKVSGFWINNSVVINARDGIYRLNITAYDNAGNINNTEQFTVTVDNTPPTIESCQTAYPLGFTAAKNGTNIILNATISDLLGGVKNASVNASQINSSMDEVTLYPDNGSWTNSSVIVNAFDGEYHLNITAYDNAGNLNNSSQITVIVDNTPPLITINPISYQRGTAAKTGSIIEFNFSAKDPVIKSTSSGLKNASVNVSLINKTGSILLTNNSGFWKGKVTFDRSLNDGNYSLNVMFSDNAGNINNSEHVNISIDNTPPSVADVFVSSPFINLNGSVNITANITLLDSVSQVSEINARILYPNSTAINYPMSSGSGNLFYINFTDTSQNGRYYVTILANDTTGNTNDSQQIQFVIGDLYSLETKQTYSSGGGGGGGGGGASGENYSNIELTEKYDLSIYKDKMTSFRFMNSGNPIIFVNITGNVSFGDITTSVEVLEHNSTMVTIHPPDMVYKNVNIWAGSSSFKRPKNIKEGIIRFRVMSTWLESNSITGIKMVRWDGSEWTQLVTNEIRNDSTYTYYEAISQSFSNFAITGAKGQPGIQILAPAPTEPAKSAPAETAMKNTETTQKTPGVEVLLVIILFFIVYIFDRS